jgi:hypothetical protein
LKVIWLFRIIKQLVYNDNKIMININFFSHQFHIVKRIFLIIFLFYFIIEGFCFADILSVNNSRTNANLIGKTVEFQGDTLLFLCDDGTIVSVSRKNIHKLSIEEGVLVELNNEEKLFGLVLVNDGVIYIDSESTGKVELNFSEVLSFTRKQKEVQTSLAPISKLFSTKAKGLSEINVDKITEEQQETDNEISENGDVFTIGEKPSEINPEEMLLRQEKVLIPKGGFETEFNLTYVDINNSAVFLGPDKVRSITMPFTVRYGITNNLASLIRVPFTMNWRETQPDVMKPTHTSGNSGIGDLSFGLNYQILDENYNMPAMMLSFMTKSDTGESPYQTPPNEESLGTGHWVLTPGISIIRTIDPIILFGSLSYDYTLPRTIDRPEDFESDKNRVEVKPGDSINFSYGTGLCLNEKVTLSFNIMGSFIFRERIDNQLISETQTPFYFSSILDYMLSNVSYIEPSALFGITNDAKNLSLSLSYVYKFYKKKWEI